MLDMPSVLFHPSYDAELHTMLAIVPLRLLAVQTLHNIMHATTHGLAFRSAQMKLTRECFGESTLVTCAALVSLD